MFGKLVKYELKSMMKIFALIWAAILVVALMTGLIIGQSSEAVIDGIISVPALGSGEAMMVSGFISGIAIFLYAALAVAVIVVSLIFIISRFGKGLLGSEGYLMFTLPTTPRQLILAKGLSATIIMVASLAVGCISIFFLALPSMGAHDFKVVIQAVLELVTEYPVSIPVLIFFIVDVILIEINFIYHIYASISIGHLFAKYRALLAVVAFIVIDIIKNIIGSIVISVGVDSDYIEYVFGNIESWSSTAVLWLAILGIAEIVGIVIFHIITEYILKDRLNLE